MTAVAEECNSMQNLILPLREWIQLNVTHQRKNINALSQETKNTQDSRLPACKNESSDCKIDDAARTAKRVRTTCTSYATQVAKLLIDRLVRSDDLEISDNNDDVELFEVEHIVTKNFVVPISLPNGVKFTGSPSASEIIQQLDTQQMESILKESAEVKLVPSLQNKVGFQIDEAIEREFYQKIGLIFYELFTGDASQPPPFCFNGDSADSPITNDEKEVGGRIDEEEPGSEKGRRKHTTSDACKALKRLDLSGPVAMLQQMSLPLSICRLVADLLEADEGDECMFRSLNDVKAEITQILEEPHIFLHEEIITPTSIHFNDDNIYGRTKELYNLIHATLQAPHLSHLNKSTVVLIGGDPGAGKSKLATSIDSALRNRGWNILSCKFDRLNQNQPLSTISSTFNDFFQNIVTTRSKLEEGIHVDVVDEQYVVRVLASIENHLSASGIVALSKLIPSFRLLFPEIFRRVVIEDDDGSGNEDDDDEGNQCVRGCMSYPNSDTDDDSNCLFPDNIKNQIHYLFQKLTYAISNPEAPMMIFLDDLHWADKESLDLLTSLITDIDHLGMDEDINQRCVCFVATYRYNDGGRNQELLDCIESIETSNVTQVTYLNLDGMGEEGTNAMISDALKLPTRLTRPLTDIVQKKTLGNPFHVQVFMAMLAEENCLKFSLKERRWIWNIDDIHKRSMVQDLALVLTQKLLRLPVEVQDALTFVSCFGRSVHRDVFAITIEMESGAIMVSDRCLELAVEERILEKSGETYTFPHDLIQQAAYDRVSKEKINAIHHHIGLQILTKAVFTGHVDLFSPLSFIGIEQITKADDFELKNSELRISLAALFLRVGRRAIRTAAFPSGLTFLEKGISFLGDDGWDLNYELSLYLHESACQAVYLNALPARVSTYVDIIMSHTEDFMDQIMCHHIAMKTLATTGKVREAIDKFFHVMKELKEEFPSNVTPTNIVSCLNVTRNDLDKYSAEEILNTPKMNDKGKQWAMAFMDTIIPYVYMVCPHFIPLIATRMVSLSLKYGLVKETASGLNTYSYSILCLLQDIDGGCRWLATTRLILDRFNASEMYPKLRLLQCSFLTCWKEPFQSVTDSISQCHQEALRVGDIEYAVFSSHMHCQVMILSGSHLATANILCGVLSKEMIRLNQVQSLLEHSSIHNMILQLAGSDENAFDFPEISFKNENEVLDEAESSGKIVIANSIYTNRVMRAFFFRNYDYAKDMTMKYATLVGNESLRFQTIFYVFYEGLLAFRLARFEKDREHWFSTGQKAINTYQTWVKHSEWNFENKLLLLEAESHFSNCDYESSERKYLASIDSARRHKFVHEEGLAMDLLASFYIDRGKVEQGKSYLKGAYLCYEKWGAFGLLKHLRGF